MDRPPGHLPAILSLIERLVRVRPCPVRFGTWHSAALLKLMLCIVVLGVSSKKLSKATTSGTDRTWERRQMEAERDGGCSSQSEHRSTWWRCRASSRLLQYWSVRNFIQHDDDALFGSEDLLVAVYDEPEDPYCFISVYRAVRTRRSPTITAAERLQ